MKYILFILLLFSCTAQAQISITANLFTSSSDGSSYGTNLNIVTGRLYIIVIESNHASATPNIPSLTIDNNTNTQFATETFNVIGTERNRITAFRFVAATTANEAVTIGFSGQTQTGFFAILYGMTGAVTTGTNGADGIVQFPTTRADATANPSITMSAIGNSANAVIATFSNDVPTNFGGTPEAGWTQDADGGHDQASMYGVHRLTTTDNTATVTASSSDWAGIAFEIKSATPSGRRRIIID